MRFPGLPWGSSPILPEGWAPAGLKGGGGEGERERSAEKFRRHGWSKEAHLK